MEFASDCWEDQGGDNGPQVVHGPAKADDDEELFCCEYGYTCHVRLEGGEMYLPLVFAHANVLDRLIPICEEI